MRPDGVASRCLSGSARKSLEQHVVVGRRGISRKPSFQKPSKSGNGGLVGAQLLAPAVVEVAQPPHLVAAFGKGGLAAEPSRQLGEDREIAARLADRRDRLLHRDDEPVAPRAADVVALQRRGRRQHDVGVARGRRPPGLVHDDGLRPLPGAAQPVDVLVMVERIAARPIDQPDVGIGAPLAVEVVALARMEQAVGDARRRDGAAERVGQHLHRGRRRRAADRRCRRPSRSRSRSRRRAARSGRAPPASRITAQ